MIDHHFGILFIIGLSAFIGLFGAWLFQKMKSPQIVGYIIVGLVLGQTGIGLIDKKHIATLEPFTFFALGLIGFLVGGELKLSSFQKYGKQFMAILLGEGLTAFLLVGISTGVLVYLFSGNVSVAVSCGIVLGAIASATDPASTINVLWEYRSKGIVTTSLIAVITLDDALAMSLYSIGKSITGFLSGEGLSMPGELLSITIELGGAIATGACISLILRYLLLRTHKTEQALAISVCSLLLVIGLCMALDMDVILSSMALGFGISNLLPKRTEKIFSATRTMSTPIYILFFVMVGARFNIAGIPPMVWFMACIYIVARTSGKFVGTWFGAKLSSAETNVRKYTGLGLFAQGGVAIGLAIVATQHLQGIPLTKDISIGECIISVVTTTTIAVQLLGPPMTKLAIKLSGEIGRNITDEDVIQSMKLSDILIPEDHPFKENDTMNTIIKIFSNNENSIKAVIDNDGNLSGVITLSSLREVLPDQDLWQWILASDVMERPSETIRSDCSVLDVINLMNDTNQAAVVVESASSPNKVVGIVELSHTKKVIKRKLLMQLS